VLTQVSGHHRHFDEPQLVAAAVDQLMCLPQLQLPSSFQTFV